MAKTEHVPHSERFNPPTFELKIGLKSAEKRSISVHFSALFMYIVCRNE